MHSGFFGEPLETSNSNKQRGQRWPLFSWVKNMKNLETADRWSRAIRAECKKNGTYKKTDDGAIAILAEIMQKREAVQRQYEAEGSRAVIEYTNGAGKTNSVKNPLLVLWLDLTSSALPYLKELGLTPAARKKLIADKEDNDVNITDLLNSKDAEYE